MRILFILASGLCLLSSASAQSVIRSLAWELDTARPAIKEWQLVRGETADLECRYLAGASSMDVRGAAVVLHCRTNGMPADLSFQVTGRVGRVSSTNLASVGWVTVRVRPDQDLPHDVTRLTFALESTLDSARNLVATGLLRLSGDPTGASPAALPVFRYDAEGSAQTVSNALASALLAALSDTVPAQIAVATGSVEQAIGPRIALLETNTNDWNLAFSWGPHTAAGYLLASAAGAFASTQQLAFASNALASALQTLSASATNSYVRAADSNGTHILYLVTP